MSTVTCPPKGKRGCPVAFTVPCPNCGDSLRVPEELLGTQVRCRKCGGEFTLSRPGNPSPVTQSPRPLPDSALLTVLPGEPPRHRRSAISGRKKRGSPNTVTTIVALMFTGLAVACCVGIA